jgi:hypothetical protein
VEVLRNASPGRPAQVHSDVETVGREGVSDPSHAAVDGGGEGLLLGGPQGIVLRDLAVGDDQQVAVVVGVPVHDDEHVLAPPQDQVLRVLFFVQQGREQRLVVGEVSGFGLGHVRRAPGTPHVIHRPKPLVGGGS